ncbi:hypothetical protein GAO09_14430 [Rhizobiales bacterium RZME27]|uniref:Uncharacterized protein n=1 Tax=Endobacterium cereale TaxID=2663029 RepID=A0A6A8A7P0_9HYPH|nr:hypothetical protein [Endobacterium cereale]MEB2843275.1 hypothetical protein [Endobacterium cereale]MQY47233.1 hypothetical protein [Endobacterium cereale]
MKWVLPIIAAVFGAPAGGAKASSELDRFLVCYDNGISGKTERKIVAGEIASTLRKMSHRISAISEEERGWLKSEIDDTLAASGSTPTTRAVEAEKSAAYAKQQERNLTERIAKTAEDIESKDMDPVKEMESWIAIQDGIFGSGYIDYIATLVRAGHLASKDVPIIVSEERRDDNFKAFTACLINSIVDDLP